MKTPPKTRVLLLANEFDSAHTLRAVAEEAGLNLDLEQVASRDEFYSHLTRKAPELIVANVKGVATLPLEDVLEHAKQLRPPAPVVVLGAEGLGPQEPLRVIRSGASDYIQKSELSRLPIVVERLVRERREGSIVPPAESDRERTAQILRENQKLITIGRLTASISHEINNPLESITNLLYLLECEPNMPTGAREYLALAQRELSRVVQISKQTLAFYRETATVVRLQPADLLEEVLVLYGRKIEEKELRVVREYDSQDSVSVFPGEIRQVFSNLVTNAIEASSVGGKLHLRVRKARQWSDSGVLGLRISIGDSGIGIPPAIRQRLGEAFFTTKGQRGTGLGLWVTQSILQRYGGHIQVCSSTAPSRHGTVFSIFLPTNMRPQAVPISGGMGASGPSRMDCGASDPGDAFGSHRLRISG